MTDFRITYWLILKLIYFKTVKEIKLRKPTANPLLILKGIKRLVSPYNITLNQKLWS